GQVGIDEMSGHQVGLGGLAAATPDDLGGDLTKTVVGYAHRALPGWNGHHASLRGGRRRIKAALGSSDRSAVEMRRATEPRPGGRSLSGATCAPGRERRSYPPRPCWP